jgi:Subunit ChlI of Mg-chelatase
MVLSGALIAPFAGRRPGVLVGSGLLFVSIWNRFSRSAGLISTRKTFVVNNIIIKHHNILLCYRRCILRQSSASGRLRWRSKSTAEWGNIDKNAVVGMPDTAVKESKDRVTSAICAGRTENELRSTLPPADVRKEGPSFDLSIALGTTFSPLDLFCPIILSFVFSPRFSESSSIRRHSSQTRCELHCLA